MIWYRFEGYAHYIIHAGMLLAGSGLALLGLLDIGSHHADLEGPSLLQGTAPILRLVGAQAPLIVVALTYWLVYYSAQIMLHVLDKLRGDVFEKERHEMAETGNAGSKAEPVSNSRETSRGGEEHPVTE